jgi:S1/P1 Nuclease
MPRLGVGFLAAATALAFLPSHGAMAWGDEGHEVVALVAQAHLDPAVLKKVNALLAADTDDLTAHDIASEATWADKFRAGHRETAAWHFVDIELSNPNLDQACFGHPAVASGQPASKGPTDDCVVDKVQEFADELSNPNTAPEEQIVALKFLLHFVGDMHQPLHAADDNDRGGNQKKVSASGQHAGNLHHFWDDVFVEQLGPDAKTIASDLVTHISKDDVQAWSMGTPADWAMESFQVAKDDAYGQLPAPSTKGVYRLDDDYMATATQDVGTQLSKGGVRLAFILNKVLSPSR